MKLQTVNKPVFVFSKELKKRDPAEFSKKNIVATETPPEEIVERQRRERKEWIARLAKLITACTYIAEVEVIGKYLKEWILPRLNPGDMLALCSAVGTGKTELMKAIIQAHKELYPDAWIVIIGYRNSLLYQTAKRLGLKHIQVLEREYPGNMGYAMREEKAVLLCMDSLNKIDWDQMPANSLILHDEADAVAAHGLGGGTLGDRQNETLALWQSIIRRCLATGGNVILAEDSITDVCLDFYDDLAGNAHPIRLVRNTWKKKQKIELTKCSRDAYAAEIAKALLEGKRVVLPTDSQIFGEQIERIVAKAIPGCKIFRLDAKTAEFPECKRFQESPNEYIEEEQPQLIILSPTAESGVSIDVPGYHVMGFLICAGTRRQFQMIGRVRNPESLIVCTKETGVELGNEWGTSPYAIAKSWHHSFRRTVMLSGIEEELREKEWSSESQEAATKLQALIKGEDKDSARWAWHQARFKARDNILKQGMADNLCTYLEARGFTVEWVEIDSNKEVKEHLKEARAEIDAETAKIMFDAPGGQSEAVARAKLSSSGTNYAERINAKKSLLQHRLPGAELSEEFLREMVVESYGKGLSKAQLKWLSEHPEVARKIDRMQIFGQLKKPITLISGLSHLGPKADLYRRSGIEHFIALVETGKEVKEDDPILPSLKEFCLNNKKDIWSLFGLNMTEAQSGVQMAGKLLKLYGYGFRVTRKEGARGSQKRVRIVVPRIKPSHRKEVEEALNRKWADELKAVGTTSINRDTNKGIVPTQSDPLQIKAGDTVLFAADGAKCQVIQIDRDKIRLKRVESGIQSQSFDAKISEVRQTG